MAYEIYTMSSIKPGTGSVIFPLYTQCTLKGVSYVSKISNKFVTMAIL